MTGTGTDRHATPWDGLLRGIAIALVPSLFGWAIIALVVRRLA